MIKRCAICGKEFEDSHQSTQACSRSCAAKLRYRRIKDKTVESLIDKYIKPMGNVDYVGGYTNSRGIVLLHCSKWDETYSMNVSDLRKPGVSTCSACFHHNIGVKTLGRWRVHGQSKKLRAKPAKHTCKMLHWVKCHWCGRWYLSGNKLSHYCSADCRNDRHNSERTMRKTRRYRQARRNGKFETISLERLYKRDKGVCYLCGKHLFLNADYNRLDAPTIEHVIPICKGGTNSWDNVRLSCRDCNVKKGTSLFVPAPVAS